MRPFDYFIGIDWSGAKGKWQKGIKVAAAYPGPDAPHLIPGPLPNGRWSRTAVASWIPEVVRDKRALIGLDFAFGFPGQTQQTGDVALDWEYVETLCQLDPNFYGGRFFRVSNAIHSRFVNSPWVPRSSYSAHCLRATELAAKRTKGATPQSIFNACGPAQVGPSSISGMRVLYRIQRRHSGSISIWPFDEIDDVRSAIVEIFPRYFPLLHKLSPNLCSHAALNTALAAFHSAPVSTPPSSEDEGDALLSAAAMRVLANDGAFFKLPDPAARKEGWIFGVPLEAAA